MRKTFDVYVLFEVLYGISMGTGKVFEPTPKLFQRAVGVCLQKGATHFEDACD